LHSVLLSKPTDLEALRRLRAILPEALLIVHGPEPTRVPEAYLLDERTAAIRGEPENALRELLAGRPAGGLSRRRGDGCEHLPIDGTLVDMAELPFPARDHPDVARFYRTLQNPKFSRGPFAPLMASRGCAFHCLFCVPNSISFAREMEYARVFGKKPPVAAAPAAKVVAEFTALAAAGYGAVAVIDDQFLWQKERTLEICRGIKPLGLEWGMLSRADFLDDPEIVAAVRDAGCVSVDIGVESLSQTTLDYVNKNLTVPQVEKALAVCRSCGLKPKLNIIIGASPTETRDDVRRTVRRLRDLEVEMAMFSIATPFKGTSFHDLAEQKGFLVDATDAIDPVKKSVISYPAPGMDKQALEHENRRAYYAFYLHPKTLWRRLRAVRGPRELWQNIKTALRLFADLK
jgi:anaerobic magnesium-protoporphyrin IX monomethyl ester cyclase